MNCLKKARPIWAKSTTRPYESFEETGQKREQDAVAVNPPLTEQQQAVVREQAGINPVAQRRWAMWLSPPITACQEAGSKPD